MNEPDHLDDSSGVRLSLDDYRVEFKDLQWTIAGQQSWKLEREQRFREPGFASWEAFSRGDWDEALRLIEEERDFLVEFSAKNAEKGIRLFRVRVVEEPIVPYLQWELHLLHLRAQCGERIRVVTEDRVGRYEATAPLPEVVTLGDSTLYRILYNAAGELDGAVRHSDPEVVAHWTGFMRDLYATGEDLGTYFRRVVAPLPPPTVEARSGDQPR